jgi:hypothetical protein
MELKRENCSRKLAYDHHQYNKKIFWTRKRAQNLIVIFSNMSKMYFTIILIVLFPLLAVSTYRVYEHLTATAKGSEDSLTGFHIYEVKLGESAKPMPVNISFTSRPWPYYIIIISFICLSVSYYHMFNEL